MMHTSSDSKLSGQGRLHMDEDVALFALRLTLVNTEIQSGYVPVIWEDPGFHLPDNEIYYGTHVFFKSGSMAIRQMILCIPIPGPDGWAGVEAALLEAYDLTTPYGAVPPEYHAPPKVIPAYISPPMYNGRACRLMNEDGYHAHPQAFALGTGFQTTKARITSEEWKEVYALLDKQDIL